MALTNLNTSQQSCKPLLAEAETITREFTLARPSGTNGTSSVVAQLEFTTGSGTTPGTASVVIEGSADGVTWQTYTGSAMTDAGDTLNGRWFPKLRAVATLAESTNTGAPVAATQASAVVFLTVPLHGTILRITDGVSPERRVMLVGTPEGSGTLDTDVWANRPQDNLWFAGIQGSPGDNTAADLTGTRDNLLAVLQGMQTSGHLLFTAAANTTNRISLTADVPGTQGNVTPIEVVGDTTPNIAALSGGTGTPISCTVTAWVNS